MPKAKQKREVETYNYWFCTDCNTEPHSHKEILQHLTTQHGVDTKGLKGERSLLVHHILWGK